MEQNSKSLSSMAKTDLASPNSWSKGYIVHDIKQRASSLNTKRVGNINQDSHVDNTNFKLNYRGL